MQASDELLTLAELAIGLAGFSGVVVAFAHRGQLTAIDRWRFAALLSLSMGAVVVAFVPSLLHLSGIVGASLWRASSIAFLVVAVPFGVVFPPRLMQIARELEAAPPASVRVAAFGLSILNLALQLCNAIGWPFAPNSALLVFGLVTWLVIASLFFGLLVLSRPES